MNLENKVIAVDFDGTCVTHEFPEVGHEIGAPEALRKIVAAGAKLVLWTMRSDNGLDEYLSDAIEWFRNNDIFLYGIQNNPTQHRWTSSPKAFANIYIDDTALGCPLKQTTLSTRPYVDWDEVLKQLEKL